MDTLTWIYLINLVFLINHEVESAYWKEWKLFRLPGGITGFLLIHFPLFFLFLLGLLLLQGQNFWGLVCSILLSMAGIFAFTAHMFFITRGGREFRLPVSIFILFSTLVLSVIQLFLTLPLIVKG